MLRLPVGSWNGEKQSLDQSTGGYGRGNLWKGSATTFAGWGFCRARLASGRVSVAQHFLLLPSGFFACTVPTKKGLLTQAAELCHYGTLGRSWVSSGKGSQGERDWASLCSPAWLCPMYSAALKSRLRNQQNQLPQTQILGTLTTQCLLGFPFSFSSLYFKISSYIKLHLNRFLKLLSFDQQIFVYIILLKHLCILYLTCVFILLKGKVLESQRF